MKSPDAPIAKKGFFVAHFLTVKDQVRSKEFYARILGGKVVKPENPCYIKLENSWIILNSGGGPTPDKPEVVLETPQNLNRVSSFLNLRVADIRDCYKKWSAKGVHFLTEPLDNHGQEWRCYMRDPDGYLIELASIRRPPSTTSRSMRRGQRKSRRRSGRSRGNSKSKAFGFCILVGGGCHSSHHRVSVRPRLKMTLTFSQL